MTKTNTSALIQQQRQKTGWSRAELARRARMHPSTIGQIESGRLQPYPDQLRRIMDALGGTSEEEAEHLKQ